MCYIPLLDQLVSAPPRLIDPKEVYNLHLYHSGAELTINSASNFKSINFTSPSPTRTSKIKRLKITSNELSLIRRKGGIIPC